MKNPKKFDPENFNLASFICDAAIEIDNHIIKRDNLKYDNIFSLGKLLYGLALNESKLNYYVTIIKDAVEGYNGRKFDRKAKIKDLSEEVIKICDYLGQFSLLEEKQQEKLREFCVNLSFNTMAYRNEYYPFRRYLVA